MTEDITLASRVQIKEEVVFRDLGGEIVVLNLQTGVYFGLDPIGARIWHMIQGHRSLEEILDGLTEEYDVPEGRCEQDLLRFVGSLREKELVEVRH